MITSKDACGSCARAWDAMPWVVQGGASPAQTRQLMDHLERCDACRDEFAQQRRLQHALSLPPDIEVNPETGFKRLLARLDAPLHEEAPARPRAAGWLVRALVAAVLVQAIGIGVLGMNQWSEEAKAPYRTFSQPPAPAVPDAIRVVPAADLTLADWDSLLHTLRLRVVDGPNSVGAYTVVGVDGQATRQRLLQQLRAARGIRLAEPVANTP
ncbi:MAG TPA: zf-HC2 domain-containing protein [Rhodanobacteraceae bacterium]|nr:zf-HC2 domain-containing protein [Rhodanobacteraceae bacterium]